MSDNRDQQWELLSKLRELGLRNHQGYVGHMRSERVEARHWLLYASQGCMALREECLKYDLDWVGWIISLDEILIKLEALRLYLAGRGLAPFHMNEMTGAGAPQITGFIMAESRARRIEP